ncbi:hypothetical protein GV67_22520 [Pseudorhizobium pelagicum]|uniref:Uncharacterized protein n=1 Tax=Pseudorhizobium pelagicum TaxID=1509405 RepID=A0A922NXJ4_9HYPH|nr:hypothetical protein GV67_22520 [Pseudorhizobium pelagicum]KEQ02226.1 hypothetical protein GV68_23640 [Pseudorhizobium pelagicum]
MARKNHLRRSGVVTHPYSFKHLRDHFNERLFRVGLIKFGMCPRQRLAPQDFVNDLTWLRNLACVDALADQFSQFQQ